MFFKVLRSISIAIVLAVSLCATSGFAQIVDKPIDQIFAPSNPLMKPFLDSVAAAKKATPKNFDDVDKLADHVKELDEKRRGPFAPVASAFKALGKEMSLPLADFVYREATKPTLTETARVSFFVGAFESFAHHQSLETVPLMFAVLQTEKNPYIARAASESIGRVGTDAHIVDLLSLANGSNDVRSGLRGCRRLACANYFATYLDATRTPQETWTALKALGSVGNSWAWKTSEVMSKDDGTLVRRKAAQTLVREFAKTTNNITWSVARKAILVVDHPETPSFIANEMPKASPAVQKELRALLKRFNDNPVR